MYVKQLLFSHFFTVLMLRSVRDIKYVKLHVIDYYNDDF